MYQENTYQSAFDAATSVAADAGTLTFTSTTTGVCTVTGSTVTIVAAGTCSITANQSGNANYAAAPQIQQSFTVGKGTQTVSFTSTAPASPESAPLISMARMEPDSAAHEFFLCVGDQPELDFGGRRNPDGQGFAAFGRLLTGWLVLKQIQMSAASGQTLTPPVTIVRARRL